MLAKPYNCGTGWSLWLQYQYDEPTYPANDTRYGWNTSFGSTGTYNLYCGTSVYARSVPWCLSFNTGC
jgi:hypothetical protein